MTVSLCPNWLGNTQPRYLDIKGDTLEITSQPVFFNGKEHNTKLIWKRVS
ncbi:lipocalin-like domain-containing protein [Bacillus subtilis]|nr:lipocalin-like domain-containing protein [Bacillus subtilis]